MKTGRVDYECGDQIIINSGKTMNSLEDFKKIACWGCGKLYDYDSVEAFRVEGEAVTYKLKIFKMNDYDWWIDTDLESAKINYLEFAEVEPEDVKDAIEISDDKLDILKYYLSEDRQSEYITFREQINLIDQVPQFFASTEY